MSRSMAGVRRLRSDDQRSRRRRRLLRSTASGPAPQVRTSSAATSSQEEYDESESESDHILSSSNEHLPHLSPTISSEGGTSSASGETSSNALSNSDDDDENTTALGIGTNNDKVFTPPANAFTHPSQAPTARRNTSVEARPSYLSSRRASQTRRTSPRRQSANSYTSRRDQQHSPYNMISPSHHADHDAALRASLSTLLSCAAAARGLPKKETQNTSTPHHLNPTNQMQPSSFRLVPESSLARNTTDTSPARPPRRRASNTSLREPDTSKRKAQPASSSKDRRNKKLLLWLYVVDLILADNGSFELSNWHADDEEEEEEECECQLYMWKDSRRL
ncbi:uncharacterized protein KY384_004049 [Bacidia gigantensis]|uniref:uncharacterized protein n=1 Tax=Bacidia gigantensis TaxID=2732470 RepID=UPI001D0506F6|nr:uncharacterized protein KY384_004049 [Bacidia gigantensis]KAG8530694.1 hypothetical protein KY384_004049 [Bacidia gigantensis]